MLKCRGMSFGLLYRLLYTLARLYKLCHLLKFSFSTDEGSLYSDSEDYESDWDSDESSDMEDSEHTLSTTIKTNIQMDKDGLGFILIQNGPYLQISGLVEKGAAARDGKLQGGDILLKIGHANVLGWTLRELRQLLHTVPIGTVLQIQVYRDFIKIPGRWEAALKNIPELKGPAIDWHLFPLSFKDIRTYHYGGQFSTASYTSEENWTSSEDSDNESEGKIENTGDTGDTGDTDGTDGTEDSEGTTGTEGTRGTGGSTEESYQEDVRVRALSVGGVLNVKAVHSLSFDPSIQPKWISKDWHIFERKTYTFTVGSDIGCDIMIHKDFEAESDADVSTLRLSSSSPYWTMPKHKVVPSASSSSSVSDAFWLESVSYEFE
ncbi:PDZ domain-containing protein 9 [Candoia aspera]|uniref:PDZ domain-containing protein 9 n=1 Tax=Candoia aspera TaxID=51853 RepID=UPI002FD7A1A0